MSFNVREMMSDGEELDSSALMPPFKNVDYQSGPDLANAAEDGNTTRLGGSTTVSDGCKKN